MKCRITYSPQQILAITKRGGLEKATVINEIIKALSACEVFIRTIVRKVLQEKLQKADAEDLIQDTLITLVQKLNANDYQGRSSIENYAMGIFKFKLNNYKRRKREILIPSSINSEEEDLDRLENKRNLESSEDVQSQYLRKERQIVLAKIISQLSGRCPQLLTLYKLGYSYREIAGKLGMNEKKANTRTWECRKKLKKIIQEQKEYWDLWDGYVED